jgi:MFS family permease
MITWGLISGLMAFNGPLAATLGMSNETMFYILRFLLGAAEAGFFPGIILYFNYWYPSHRQSRAMSLLLAAQPVAFIIGAPLSGGIMDVFEGVKGVHGWQWMYLIEAAPAVVLGLAVIYYLSNGIEDAAWLSRQEKMVLESNLDGENREKVDYPLTKLFAIPMMWIFTLIYLLIVIGVYGINFWLPSIINATGIKSFFAVGLITAVPYAISVGFMIAATRHAEQTNEKRWHTTIAAVLGGIGLILSAYFADNTWLTVVFITMAIAGSLTAMALFWSFPGSILTGAAVAAGLAAINSVGNLGGFFGPTLLGWMTGRFGSSNAGLAALGGLMIAAGVLVAATCRTYGLRHDEAEVKSFSPLPAVH